MHHSRKQQSGPWLLICALRQESLVILNQYPYSQEKTPQGYTFFQIQNREMFLLEIGSGKRIDRSKLKSAIIRINPGFIINFGICGALGYSITRHTNYLAKSISYDNEPEIDLSQDLNLLTSYANPHSVLRRVRLLTVKDPVLDSIKREELQRITACELAKEIFGEGTKIGLIHWSFDLFHRFDDRFYRRCRLRLLKIQIRH